MSTLVTESECESFLPFQTASDALIRQQVDLVFQAIHQTPVVNNRRCDRREPFPYPIYITPLDAEGQVLIDETIVVLGKHLSERGVDFYYKAPVPHRQVIASLEYASGCWFGFLLDLRWCRSNRHGWYENGGRFLQVVEPLVGNQYSPLGDAVDPAS